MDHQMNTTETPAPKNREGLSIATGVTVSLLAIVLTISIFAAIILAFIYHPEIGFAVIAGTGIFAITTVYSSLITYAAAKIYWAVIGRPVMEKCRPRTPQPGPTSEHGETYYRIINLLGLASFIPTLVLGTAISIPLTLNHQMDMISTTLTISLAIGTSIGIPTGIWATVINNL